jgi:hypothetical protein
VARVYHLEQAVLGRESDPVQVSVLGRESVPVWLAAEPAELQSSEQLFAPGQKFDLEQESVLALLSVLEQEFDQEQESVLALLSVLGQESVQGRGFVRGRGLRQGLLQRLQRQTCYLARRSGRAL